MVCQKCGRRTYMDETVCPKCGAPMPVRRKPHNFGFPEDIDTSGNDRRPAQQTRSEQPLPYTTTQVDYTYTAPVRQPEPVQQPVKRAEPVVQEPKPPVQQPPKPTAQQQTQKKPAPERKPQPQPVRQEQATVDWGDPERTLSCSEARNKPQLDSQAVLEYSRMRRDMMSDTIDETKMTLDRLPEGYVYVKMTIDEANKLGKRKNLPSAMIIVVVLAVCITAILMVVLSRPSAQLGQQAEPIVGEWTSVIDATQLGIDELQVKRLDTIWEFKANGNLTITANTVISSSYYGSYTLYEQDGKECVAVSVNIEGEILEFDATYVIEEGDSGKQLKLFYIDNPIIGYVLDELK